MFICVLAVALYPYSTQATNRPNRHELIFFVFWWGGGGGGNPSAISSLVLLLGLISRFPTNELRVATNAQNNAKTPPNRLRFSYDIQECLRNLVRITHDFSNRGIRCQSFEQFKTFEPNSRKTYELQELTTDYANQFRPSRTEYDSATNPNICQFVSIRGIRGLCGIGVLNNCRLYGEDMVCKIC